MVLTNRDTAQRRWISGGNQFDEPFGTAANHYQQRHHNRHDMLPQRNHYPTVYNDLNLFNPPANVNVVKPQPPADGVVEPSAATALSSPPRVSHISSNGYYGFVHIHCGDIYVSTDNDNGQDVAASEEVDASMDCSEEEPCRNARKRGFEQLPVYIGPMTNAAKKCRLDYEDDQMAADDDTMCDGTATASAAAMAPPISTLQPMTGNNYIKTNEPQLQQTIVQPQPSIIPPAPVNNQYCLGVGGTLETSRCMISHML